MNFDKPKTPSKVKSLKNRLSPDDRAKIYTLGKLEVIWESIEATSKLMELKKLGDGEGESHVDFLVKCMKARKDLYLDEDNTLTRSLQKKIDELEEKKENNSSINEEGELSRFPSYEANLLKKRAKKSLPKSD
jgi:hypothetical protein